MELHTFTVLDDAHGRYIPGKGRYHGRHTEAGAMRRRAEQRIQGHVVIVPLSQMPDMCRELVARVEAEEGRPAPSLVRVWVVAA
jgi:hypothetical protein